VSQLRIGLLGTFELERVGRPVAVPTGKQAALLATLAVSAGKTVSLDELIERLWGQESPPSAATTIRGHVKGLRRVLDVVDGESAISCIRGAYRLEISAEDLDLHRFTALTERAAAADDPDSEATLLNEALALWRGPILCDVPCDSLRRELAPVFEEQRAQALQRRIDLDLARGLHIEVVAELRGLVAQHPLREKFWAQLIRALGHAGRQAEALAHYEECRAVLADQLGVDPGPQLQELHRQLLARDSAAIAAQPRSAEVVTIWSPVPRQLPADAVPFVGRMAELAALNALLDGDDTSGGAVVVDGTSGVGKTALATRWAHGACEAFPDGQIFLDLHGYGPGEPLDPATALETLLAGLHVPRRDVPPCQAARGALFRSALSGKRLIVVLDNARDVAQVRPLMPGLAHRTVITSRNQLRGLVAHDGARRLTLDRLNPGEASALLRRLLGDQCRAGERGMIDELATLCSGIPAALRTLAERAGRCAQVPLAEFVAGLRDDRSRMRVFGGSAGDLSRTLSWSCAALPADAVRLLRLIGERRSDVVSVQDAARLLNTSRAEADRLLDLLAEVHLVTAAAPGVVELDTLVRDFAVSALTPASATGPTGTPRDRHSTLAE
jgi:DNA-binding SARP family transcriptional activator